MNYETLRINKLREYLINIIDEINNNNNSQVNVDMLSNKVEDYSIDKMPVNVENEKWIIGTTVFREVYSLRTRKRYSQDTVSNLMNIGFFERFENKIKYNNEHGILPDINNIETISCLNCGTMNFADTNTAEFAIQIQITYRGTDEEDNQQTSL